MRKKLGNHFPSDGISKGGHIQGPARRPQVPKHKQRKICEAEQIKRKHYYKRSGEKRVEEKNAYLCRKLKYENKKSNDYFEFFFISLK